MEHDFLTIICAHCGDHFDVPVYCGDRFCSVCSVARRNRVRNRLDFLVKNVERRVGYNFKHLTLTIKNQSNLSVMTDIIMSSFKALRKTSSWKKHVCGGAFVIEVTGGHGNWHVHLHIIIQSLYYDFKEILKLWMRLSPGRGVYIQNIPKDQIVHYLTKYLSKSETPKGDRDELNRALKGTRLFHAFGVWYALNRKYTPPEQTCKVCDKPCFCLYREFYEFSDFLIKKVV